MLSQYVLDSGSLVIQAILAYTYMYEQDVVPSIDQFHWHLLQAFRKLDEIATHHTEKLRKLTKQVQEHRQNHDDEAVKRVVEEYDETLEWYVSRVVFESEWQVFHWKFFYIGDPGL